MDFFSINKSSFKTYTLDLFCKAKVLVGDFALTYNIGGTGQIEISDVRPIPIHIDNQLTAGHVDPDTMSADFALQCKNCNHRAGTCAAGIGEILNAPLKGSLINEVFA